VAEESLSSDVLRGVRRGDRDAWELLYHLYSQRLFAFLMMRLSHADDAGEALSETFLRAIEKVSSFRGEAASLRPWLFAIARNVAFDRLRLRKRQVPQAEIDDVIDLTALGADERIIDNQQRSAVGVAFGQLPADDQEVLWLRFAQGLTSGEVAKIIGKRAGAVRMQQLRALQVLGQAVED
jgi:RNA polymerase sigma-70 factor (ECF subfamily)